MTTVIVKNQAEWDALPEKFEEWTVVHIYSDPKVPLLIKRTPGNATIDASWNATVRASENATIRASGNATIEASWNATIRASGNATIEASGNATIEAWGNATVRASGNATIEAWGNAILRLLSDAIKAEAFNAVVIVCQDCKPTIKWHGTGVTVVRTKKVGHTIKSFYEIYGDGTKPLTLYKSVRDDLCDHHTGAIKYEGVVECPDWDPNPERQCGGGLHLSPTPGMALLYHDGKVLECLVEKKDIVVFADDITKVRCRKVKVIGEWKS